MQPELESLRGAFGNAYELEADTQRFAEEGRHLVEWTALPEHVFCHELALLDRVVPMLAPASKLKDGIEERRGVSCGEHPGNAGLQSFVHKDAIGQGDAAVLQKADVRHDADAQDHEIAGQPLAVAAPHRTDPLAIALERHRLAVAYLDALVRAALEEELADGRGLQRVEDPTVLGKQGDVDAQFVQAGGHLHANEAGPDHDRARAGPGGGVQGQRIANVAQAMDTRQFRPGNAQAQGLGASGDQERVVLELAGAVGRDGTAVGVDRQRARVAQQLDVEIPIPVGHQDRRRLAGHPRHQDALGQGGPLVREFGLRRHHDDAALRALETQCLGGGRAGQTPAQQEKVDLPRDIQGFCSVDGLRGHAPGVLTSSEHRGPCPGDAAVQFGQAHVGQIVVQRGLDPLGDRLAQLRLEFAHEGVRREQRESVEFASLQTRVESFGDLLGKALVLLAPRVGARFEMVHAVAVVAGLAAGAIRLERTGIQPALRVCQDRDGRERCN